MVRLLSTCVVLVLVATLILDCEALRIRRPNQFCCVRRRCTVGSRVFKCCGIGRVCRGRFGYLKGRCVRRRCRVKSGRDVEEEPEMAWTQWSLTPSSAGQDF